MARSNTAQLERTLEMATRFLDEVRRDIEKAATEGTDTPPRLRSVHEKFGQSSPEYRTLVIPVPQAGGGASPEILSSTIARYAADKSPERLLLALEAVMEDEEGGTRQVLIAEARDQAGTRVFWMQPFRITQQRVEWDEPLEGGWRDPGKEEMILDAAYTRRAGERSRRS